MWTVFRLHNVLFVRGKLSSKYTSSVMSEEILGTVTVSGGVYMTSTSNSNTIDEGAPSSESGSVSTLSTLAPSSGGSSSVRLPTQITSTATVTVHMSGKSSSSDDRLRSTSTITVTMSAVGQIGSGGTLVPDASAQNGLYNKAPQPSMLDAKDSNQGGFVDYSNSFPNNFSGDFGASGHSSGHSTSLSELPPMVSIGPTFRSEAREPSCSPGTQRVATANTSKRKCGRKNPGSRKAEL